RLRTSGRHLRRSGGRAPAGFRRRSVVGSWLAPVDGGPSRTYHPLDGLLGASLSHPVVVHSTGALLFFVLSWFSQQQKTCFCFFNSLVATPGINAALGRQPYDQACSFTATRRHASSV